MCRFVVGLLVLWPAFPAEAESVAPLRVYVSIEPLRYLVERVGGQWADVAVVVPGGQRPETYEPAPRQIAGLAEAAVFFGVGMPLESAWRRQLRSDADSPRWVDLSTGLAGAHDGGTGLGTSAADHNGHNGIDPHVWLSPVRAQRMVAKIDEVLSELAPERASRFEANAAALHEALDVLHRDIEAIVKDSGVDGFLVFHPAWGHFARAYGLEQIAIEAEGKEPGPRRITEVIRRAKQAGVRTLFIDPRHGARLAETVAEAIGARIEMLDPLSSDYMNNLRRAAKAIAASGGGQ